MLIVFLAISYLALVSSTVAFFALCGREKRFPSFVFMAELVGRWWQIPADRRDPWVSTAVIGYIVGLASVIGIVALSVV